MQKRRYPGVSPFTSEQKNIFFGRDNDIVKLHKLISMRKQVLLYSKSGIGKTSLLNAGVLPLLESKFIPLKIRLTAYNKDSYIEPHNRIIDAFQNYMAENNIKIQQTFLKDLYKNSNFEKNVWFYFKNFQLAGLTKKQFILIFDQFEELFSYPDEMITKFKEEFHTLTNTDIPAEIKQKIAEIDDISDETIDALYDDLNIKTVFAIRSDRLSLLNMLTDKIPDIQETYYELKPLDEAQTKAAIINPATSTEDFETKQFKFDSNAVNKIISALTENGKQSVETTQLQIVCQKIEDIAQLKSNQTLDQSLYVITEKDLPEFKDIFLSFYDETVQVITQNNKQQTEIRKFIEDQLIRNNQRISLDEIICIDYVTKETLQMLVNQHLLRAERNSTGGFSYELSHDTLIEPISTSRKTRIEREQAEIAEKERQEELRKAHEKAEQERKEREKERKRQRTIITIVSIAAVISLAFAVFGFWQMDKALKSKAETIKATTDGYFKDAQALINQERFEEAMNKYFYLRDTILNERNSTTINQKIVECRTLDSISTLFYDNLNLSESKIIENTTNSLLEARKLLENNKNLNYTYGQLKLEAMQEKLQIKIDIKVKEYLETIKVLKINNLNYSQFIDQIKDLDATKLNLIE